MTFGPVGAEVLRSATVGSGDSAMPASGLALADLWDECDTVYARKARIRAV